MCCCCTSFLKATLQAHEVVQGVARHSDAEHASKVPLCHVPGGSGNGIAASCGLWTPATAAHAIVHGQSTPMDAATVLQPRSGSRYLAALSVQYGMMTNLDVDTEHLRGLLGGERFTYGAVREIMKFKAYEAQLAWVPEEQLSAVQARCEKVGGGDSERCALLVPEHFVYGGVIALRCQGDCRSRLPCLDSLEEAQMHVCSGPGDPHCAVFATELR